MEAFDQDRFDAVLAHALGDQSYVHSPVVNPTAKAYLMYLFDPYIDSITTLPDLSSVQAWIQQYIPGQLGEETLDIATATYNGPGSDNLQQAKIATIEHLYGTLIASVKPIIDDIGSNVILPWDIAQAILKDRYFALMFPDTTDKLPVTFKIDGIDPINKTVFTFDASEEYIAGLIDGYVINGQIPPTITLYGVELPYSYHWIYFVDGEEFNDGRHKQFDTSNYTAELIGNYSVAFDTPDYIQGLKSATDWMKADLLLNVDFNSLGIKVTDKNGQPVTFEI